MNRAAVLAGVGLALNLFLNSPVVAQTDVVHGCASAAIVRVLPPNSPYGCNAHETPMSWNVTGPQGVPGIPGAIGPQGPAGAAGPAGAQGSIGLTGPGGAQGPAGPIGTPGATGPTGPSGAMGPTGAAGPVGVAGPQGAPGATGPTGAAGSVGLTGAAGAQGQQGAIGLQGAIGPQGGVGPAGPAGSPGQAGAQGAIGPQGPTGTKGDTGGTGPQGVAGLKGDKGETGAKGDTGATGVGAMGPQGPTGPTGPAGAAADAVAAICAALGKPASCNLASLLLAKYVDHGNGTVTDTATGLTWEKKVTCGAVDLNNPHCVENLYSWSLASPWNFDGTAKTAFLDRLNDVAGGGANCLAGHCDWRLPSVEGADAVPSKRELETLALSACPGGGLPCIDTAVFGPTQAFNYFSSSSRASSSNIAWTVSFDNGVIIDRFKFNASNHARAVRGGQ